MRTVWLEFARRDPKSFSTKSDLYLCEDHFNAESHSHRLQPVKLQHVQSGETVELCDSIPNGAARSDAPNPCLSLNYNKGTVALHIGLTDEGRGRTVIYSDHMRVGLGPMLGNSVGHQNIQGMKNKELEVSDSSFSICPLLFPSDILLRIYIPTEDAGNALVTLWKSQVSMGN
ncbi:hypothetical protein EVAR_79331_1 [Eumeta japonica]|uniref:THAP-type domain-containing protein n=1 Tax=Eumeta variegata TaxID=151549 RepID=A0A4C1THV3_EUMVA|nr:hypothetical protein EVAR_79331_1 [Eumeta japonica]